jgi:transcriptional regulator with XRE-family HTH domain
MKWLASLRKAKGITQKKLAIAMGVENNTVWKWEHGYVKPSMNTVQKLADFFGVSLNVLLNGPEINKEDESLIKNNDIKAKRIEAGYTLDSLSSELDVFPNTIWRWEAGKREPNFEMLRRMAKLFNCSIDELLGSPTLPRIAGNGKGGALTLTKEEHLEIKEAMLNLVRRVSKGAAVALEKEVEIFPEVVAILLKYGIDKERCQ